MNLNLKAKRVLCYGDSNTWGYIPIGIGKKRYNITKRWPGKLQKKLGKNYEVIENGLPGRTTMFDDPRPDFPERNGLKTLPIILETNLPLDYVIIMLGTTDTKEMLNLKVEEIVNGINKLIRLVKDFKKLENTKAPKIIIIAPPIINEEAKFASNLFKGATDKSKKIIKLYKKLCTKENVIYIDSSKEIIVDKNDGIHFDETNHKKLANLIYNKIR
ncbi:MAG: GDSL-type esterase/lipase family protein [archaeon]